MLHLRRVTHLGAVIAFAMLATAARATITVQFTTYNLGGSANAQTLQDNGWRGVLISAVSDGNPVGGFDLDTGTRGITGTFVQVDTLQDQFGTPTSPTSTPTGITPSTAPGTTVNLQDSFFSTFANYNITQTVTLAENNDGSSHTVASPPQSVYNFVPLADTAALDYGIGTRLNGAVEFKANQTNIVSLAFVIAPIGSTVHVVGQFADDSQDITSGFLVDQSFVVPEPTSLGMLAAGGLALLARRRRRA